MSTLPNPATLTEVILHHILHVLHFHGGNRTHAAKSLDIDRRTLYRYLKECTAKGLLVPPPTRTSPSRPEPAE